MPLYSLYKRVLRHIELMERMLDTVGVRAALRELPDGPEQLSLAANRCLTCGSADRCEQFLDQHDREAEAPAFCRNKTLLDRLKAIAEAGTRAA